MFKRMFLFLVTNIAIIVVVSIAMMIIEKVFGIPVSGYVGDGYIGLFIFALLFGFAGSFLSLAISRWIAKKTYNINIINRDNIVGEKDLLVYNVVEEIASNNNIKIPEVGIYESDEPNAFATGPSKNSSLVAVSTGLLNKMSKEEIEGVIAHEMAHILNGDMVTMALLQGILNTFVIFISRLLAGIIDNFLKSNNEETSEGASWTYYLISIALEIVFGILASMIAMWFSRHREFRADEGSARFVGKEKMIAALTALKNMQNIMTTTDDDKLASMKISSKKRSGIMSLFSSHPDLDDRIKALEENTSI